MWRNQCDSVCGLNWPVRDPQHVCSLRMLNKPRFCQPLICTSESTRNKWTIVNRFFEGIQLYVTCWLPTSCSDLLTVAPYSQSIAQTQHSILLALPRPPRLVRSELQISHGGMEHHRYHIRYMLLLYLIVSSSGNDEKQHACLPFKPLGLSNLNHVFDMRIVTEDDTSAVNERVVGVAGVPQAIIDAERAANPIRKFRLAVYCLAACAATAQVCVYLGMHECVEGGVVCN